MTYMCTHVHRCEGHLHTYTNVYIYIYVYIYIFIFIHLDLYLHRHGSFVLYKQGQVRALGTHVCLIAEMQSAMQ